MSTGARQHPESELIRRKVGSKDNTLDEIIQRTELLKLADPLCHDHATAQPTWFHIGSIILLTMISAYVRLYEINGAGYVVWDEAHFGKFGLHYLQREYFFDVHPPLGKMLVGLSGYIGGYDGGFGFDSGTVYPEDCNHVVMRCINAIFGIACTPLAYVTALVAGYTPATVWLITILVIFELISLTLSKFILLDSMLLFFTVLTYFCLVKFHQIRVQGRILLVLGLTWLAISGVSIGCVCSVKWVGLFITATFGIYTVYDLYVKHCQWMVGVSSFKQYLAYWITRIITLIVIPFMVYLACFWVHFSILNRSGPGDGSVSSLLQASFHDNQIKTGPRTVNYGSLITLRSHGLSPNLLHSHDHVYPEGSQQQQITTYGYKDTNNDFLVEFDLDHGNRGIFATDEPADNETVVPIRPLTDGDVIRLVHHQTGCLLHSHAIPAMISTSLNEVSCYGSLEVSDIRDEWVIEISEQQMSPDPYFHSEDPAQIHPISTNFRLRHRDLGCYLTTSGYQYPAWGFGQGEVVCKHSLTKLDKTTWWNVENHVNDMLETPDHEYIAPKPRFWKEFVVLNYAMMTSNNALVPDPDKFDRLSSEWWQWPISHVGLRMCGWGADDRKYFLVGQPAVTWGSTLALVTFTVVGLCKLWRWQRQKLNYQGIEDAEWDKFIVQGILPFLAWFCNYLPFITMARVTYVHHYAPALYFAIFVMGYMVEQLGERIPSLVRKGLYFACYVAIVGVFYYFRELSFGMVGPSLNFRHLKLLPSWMV